MPKKDIGIKRHCKSCDTRFYDMNRPEPVCPKCKTPVAIAKKRVYEESLEPVPVKKEPPKKKLDLDDDLDILDDDEDMDGLDDLDDRDDEGLIEDTSDFETLSDDMSEVVDHIDDGVEDRT